MTIRVTFHGDLVVQAIGIINRRAFSLALPQLKNGVLGQLRKVDRVVHDDSMFFVSASCQRIFIGHEVFSLMLTAGLRLNLNTVNGHLRDGESIRCRRNIIDCCRITFSSSGVSHLYCVVTGDLGTIPLIRSDREVTISRGLFDGKLRFPRLLNGKPEGRISGRVFRRTRHIEVKCVMLCEGCFSLLFLLLSHHKIVNILITLHQELVVDYNLVSSFKPMLRFSVSIDRFLPVRFEFERSNLLFTVGPLNLIQITELCPVHRYGARNQLWLHSFIA